MSEPTSAGESLMKLTDAAAYLGVSRSTLQTWVWKRRVPFVRVGALTRFRPESLREWVATREVKPNPSAPRSSDA